MIESSHGVGVSEAMAGGVLPNACGFGHGVASLAIDFKKRNRVELATDVLCLCVPDSNGMRRDFESLSVSRRCCRLVEIACHTFGMESMPVRVQCASCHADDVEVELSLEALRGLQSEAELQTLLRWPVAGNRIVALRRPTGADQYGWDRLSDFSAETRSQRMAECLIAEGDVPEGVDWIPGLAEAFAAFDPLAAFRIQCNCPSCGAEIIEIIPLAERVFQRLAAFQRRLVITVHRLATAYGWTEETIMNIPPSRREEYLNLLLGSQLK